MAEQRRDRILARPPHRVGKWIRHGGDRTFGEAGRGGMDRVGWDGGPATALHIAVRNSQVQAFKTLLNLGGTVNWTLDTGGRGTLWFGGTYTEGWVDKEKSETMEGGRQGVVKIKAFLDRHSKSSLQ